MAGGGHRRLASSDPALGIERQSDPTAHVGFRSTGGQQCPYVVGQHRRGDPVVEVELEAAFRRTP